MKRNNTIGLPAGFRDLLFEEARSLRAIEASFAALFDRRGYGEILPSGVEFLDVYARGRQSVKDVTFKFLDREDNLLALRADFTPAMARIIGAGALDSELPHRIWYSGSVFRKADWHRGRFHEFRQVGAELENIQKGLVPGAGASAACRRRSRNRASCSCTIRPIAGSLPTTFPRSTSSCPPAPRGRRCGSAHRR